MVFMLSYGDFRVVALSTAFVTNSSDLSLILHSSVIFKSLKNPRTGCVAMSTLSQKSPFVLKFVICSIFFIFTSEIARLRLNCMFFLNWF